MSTLQRNIYFVRHGQTIGNVMRTTQGPNTPLTTEGINQAHAVAERLSVLDFDSVLSSTYARARDTGVVIATKKNVDLTTSVLLREIQRPSEMIGRSSDDEVSQKIMEAIKQNWGKSGWQYTDEDTFDMVFTRVQKALEYIVNNTEGDIVVTTHGNFLRMIINFVLTKSRDPKHYTTIFNRTLVLSNTGISHALYDQENGWRFVSINDSVHIQ